MRRHGDYDRLYRRHVRGQYQPAVVSVRHDYGPYQPRGHAPGGLMRVSPDIVPVGELYVESFCESVSEIMRSACLQRLAVVHERFYGVGRYGAGEFVAFGLLPFYYGHGQVLAAGSRHKG